MSKTIVSAPARTVPEPPPAGPGFESQIKLAALVIGFVVAIVLAAPGLSAASPPRVLDLSVTAPFLRLDGTHQFGTQGQDVASIGDFDGDGFDDMISSDHPRELGSEARVVYGAPEVGYVPENDPGEHGDKLFVGGDKIRTVDAAGDFDHNGRDDALVFVPNWRNASGEAVGAVFVVLGTPDRRDRNLYGLWSEAIRMEGFEDVMLLDAHGAGDVNGDGFDDVTVSYVRPVVATEPPNDVGAFVVFGDDSAEHVRLGALGSRGFKLFTSSIESAPTDTHAAGAGDTNGDGLDDVIVGDPSRPNFELEPYAGGAWVAYGKRDAEDVNLDALGAGGFEIWDAPEMAQAGAEVAAAGDVNADGFDDMIMGAPALIDVNQRNTGAYVVYGAARQRTVTLFSMSPSEGFEIKGASAGDMAGYAVGGGGDANGDGFADVIVGSYLSEPAIDKGGAAHVVYGRRGAETVDLGSLDGTRGFKVEGIQYGFLGNAVDLRSDLNNDGFDDAVLGSPSVTSKTGVVRAGSAWVVQDCQTLFGGCFRGRDHVGRSRKD